jgi:hypothetical protein
MLTYLVVLPLNFNCIGPQVLIALNSAHKVLTLYLFR